MADNGDKTFTETEHLAILTDRVATETAELSTQKAALEAEKSDLQSKLDIAESAKAAAEQERDTAVQELADFKGQIEQEREAAARKDDRLAKVKEVAAHLGDDFFADEARVTRIVAMEEGTFEGYLDDLKATAPATTTTSTTAPRETAMAGAGSTAAGEGPQPSAATELFLGRFRGSQKED